MQGQYDMLKNADVPGSDVSPSQVNLVLQSPMPPGQYDMLKNADVPEQ